MAGATTSRYLQYAILWHILVTVCTNYCPDQSVPVVQFCRGSSKAIRNKTQIYIDTSGIPIGDGIECPCTLSGDGVERISIEAVESAAVPGRSALIVGNKLFDTFQDVPFTGEVRILFKKLTREDVVQCIKFTAEYNNFDSKHTFRINCDMGRNLTPLPSNEENTDEPSGDRQNIENTDEPSGDSQNIGVIIGCVIGGIVIITATIVIAIILIRRYRKPSQQKSKPQRENPDEENYDYDMTVNASYEPADEYDVIANTTDDNAYDALNSNCKDIAQIKQTIRNEEGYTQVNKPIKSKVSDTETVEYSVYDHTNENKTAPVTGNIYSTTHFKLNDEIDDNYHHIGRYAVQHGHDTNTYS